VLTKKARHVQPASGFAAPATGTRETAAQIFMALSPLHALGADELELLGRAHAGLRFLDSTGVYSTVEHELFGIALAELPPAEAFVVESAACLAADCVALAEPTGSLAARQSQQHKATWIAAVLRLTEGLCTRGCARPSGTFATWTDDVLYLEFDGTSVSPEGLASARARLGALEALTGRRVHVAASAIRRGAA